jgi:hypothetical protein
LFSTQEYSCFSWLELQDGIERRSAAFAPVDGPCSRRQHRPKQRKIDDLLQLLERLALCRKLLQPFLDAPKS